MNDITLFCCSKHSQITPPILVIHFWSSAGLNIMTDHTSLDHFNHIPNRYYRRFLRNMEIGNKKNFISSLYKYALEP